MKNNWIQLQILQIFLYPVILSHIKASLIEHDAITEYRYLALCWQEK